MYVFFIFAEKCLLSLFCCNEKNLVESLPDFDLTKCYKMKQQFV